MSLVARKLVYVFPGLQGSSYGSMKCFILMDKHLLGKLCFTNEPGHEKTNILHMQNKDAEQLRSFAVTAKLISAFVFAT